MTGPQYKFDQQEHRQMSNNPMDAAEALQIVLDLAKFANQSYREDSVTHRTYAEAIKIVEDIAVNQFGDD